MIRSYSIRSVFILAVASIGLAACGSDTTTVVHEKPIYIEPAQASQPVIIHEHD